MTRYRILSLNDDVSWQYDAACLGMTARTGEDPFFHPDLKQARLLCSMCHVKEECLRFALENDCVGIWGGTTETQRRKLAG